MKTLITLVAIISMLSAPSGAFAQAQTATAPAVADSFMDLQRVLTVGQQITVTDVRGNRIRGTLAELSSTTLTVRDKEQHVLAEDQVSTVARAGDRLWNGALMGAGVGFGAFIKDGAYQLAPLGAGIGAAIGLAIDAAMKKDSTLYRAPSAAKTHASVTPIVSRGRRGFSLALGF